METEGEIYFKQGYQAYVDGYYEYACNLLHNAWVCEHYIGAATLGDIMKRDLCGHKHDMKEASQAYVTASKIGDSSITSYIVSLGLDPFTTNNGRFATLSDCG